MAGFGVEQVSRGVLKEMFSPTGIDNVDWLAMREEWVTTGISLKELSIKYDIKYNTVRSYYYRHHWPNYLAEYREQTFDQVKKIRERKAEELGIRLMKLDERVVDLCETVLDGLQEDIDLTLDHKEAKDSEPNTIDVKEAVNTLRMAVETIQKLHASVRLAGGGPTARLDLNVLPQITDEEKKRLYDEFEYLRRKPKTPILVSHAVVSDQSSQDTQGTEDNV